MERGGGVGYWVKRNVKEKLRNAVTWERKAFQERVPISGYRYFFLYLHLQVLIPYVAKDNPCFGDGPVLIPYRYSSAPAFSVSRAEFDCGCKMACKSS